MAVKIGWSPEALEDLESIAEYINRDSEFYARSVVTKIVEICKGLGEYPLLGRVVPELANKNIRERFVYSYRVVYRIERERILILAIIHGKRLIESISERFK